MLQIIDGVPFIGKATGRYRVVAHDLGNGHVEVTTPQVIEWQEAEWSPQVMADHLEVVRQFREEHPEVVEERNRERAARRAKTRVRRLCKAMGADTLLTLTYRANVTDLDRMKADLKEFNRRLVRVHPSFRCVAGFETQGRGAWHAHLATAGIPRTFVVKNGKGVPSVVKSFDLLRSIWRSVTGENGGNVDLARRKRHNRKSPAKVAAYLSKYIGKMFAEGVKWANRWTKYGNCEVPPPEQLGVVGSLREALEVAYFVIGEDRVVATMALDRFKDWFFLAAETREIEGAR